MEQYTSAAQAFSGNSAKFSKFYDDYNSETSLKRIRNEAATRFASNAYDLAQSKAQSAASEAMASIGLSQEQAGIIMEQSTAAGIAAQGILGTWRKFSKLQEGDKKPGKEDGKGPDSDKLDEVVDKGEAPPTKGTAPPIEETSPVDVDDASTSLFTGKKWVQPDDQIASDLPLGQPYTGDNLPTSWKSGMGEEASDLATGTGLESKGGNLGAIPDDILDKPGGRLDFDGSTKTQMDSDALESATKSTAERGAEEAGGDVALEEIGGEAALTAAEAAGAVMPEAIPAMLAVAGVVIGLKQLLHKDPAKEATIAAANTNTSFVAPKPSSAPKLPVNTIFNQSAEFTIPTYDSVTDIAPSITAW